MPRADVDIFFSTNKPAFAYVDGGEAVGEASAVAAGASGPVDVAADLTGAVIVAETSSAIVGLTVTSDTFHSIGMVLDLAPGEDPNYEYTCAVRYRKVGAPAWSDGTDLLRQDYQWFYINNYPPTQPALNNLAGSLMFLTPGTAYEVELTLSDLGGTLGTYNFQATTRAIPRKPVGGNIYYVDSSSGGLNSGTSANPWLTIGASQATVVPGDIVRIRTGAGPYTTSDNASLITTPGTEDNWIVYEPDIGHSPVIGNMPLTATAEYVWFNNLTFTWQGTETDPYVRVSNPWYEDGAIYSRAGQGVGINNICVTDCTFNNYLYSVYCPYICNRWTVMDNVITGHYGADQWYAGNVSSGGGVGVGLGGEGNPGGVGHAIAYNTITETGDAIAVGGSTFGHDCDVYGNNIYETVGNSVSFDGSYHNLRCYGNIMVQCGTLPITIQPQRAGPWYYLYNQIGGTRLGLFKWRVQDRLVFINNTIVGPDNEANYFMTCYGSNNLWISETNPIWTARDNAESNIKLASIFAPKYAINEMDYNGFDWGGSGTAFTWFPANTPYTSIATFSAAAGIEQNSTAVVKENIFTNWVYNGPFRNDADTADSYAIQTDPLLLATGDETAIAKGQKLDNLADFYANNATVAPDYGCHNRTDGAPQYGQRNTGVDLHLRTDDWIKH